MILVTLGTQDKSFIRLLNVVEKLVKNRVIDDEVVVQAGYTKFKSEFLKVFDYISIDDFKRYLEKADLIITHGGVGTIMSALSANKKIIGCARLAKFEEHQNDHQKQILETFDKEGYLIYAEDLDNLVSYIEKSKSFVPNAFKSNTENMISLIKNYIINN